jgi:ABC-2 type transport system permease protein
VFRDKRTLLILFGLPVVQIVLFGFALSSEVKNIGITVLDNAHDNNSRQIINRIKTSSFFLVKDPVLNYRDIEEKFKEGSIKCALLFPANFGGELSHFGKAQIQIITDGSDPNTATIVVNYLTAIISTYQQQIKPAEELFYQIIPKVRYYITRTKWLNFILSYCSNIHDRMYSADICIDRERKRIGTMEVLLVSPFKPIMVLIAKAVPHLVLYCICIILIFSVYLLDIHIKGNPKLIFAESILLLSLVCRWALILTFESQQTAMYFYDGMMLPTLLLTGFMFPLKICHGYSGHISRYSFQVLLYHH